MFAKTWRVHVIFTQTTIGKKTHVTDAHLILGVLCLTLIDSLILSIWFIVDSFEIKDRDVGSPIVGHFYFKMFCILPYCTLQK